MSQVTADPAKLRQFAKTVSACAQQLEQLTRQLQRGLDQTGWRDGERQKFEADFGSALRSIRQVSEKLNSHFVPQLQRKAEALERFQS
jgi:uncharacterized protein YukE